jgi:hypothetical protein
MGKKNDREFGLDLLDFPAKGKGIHIVQVGHGHDHVEFLLVQVLQRGIGRGGAGHPGGLAQFNPLYSLMMREAREPSSSRMKAS